MKIALIGYGKMGREIASLAKKRGHDIALVIDINNSEDLNKENLQNIDVAFEFSSPDSAYTNILTCLKSSIPVVVGTTGWLDRWDDVVKVCIENKAGLFYASNYSIGVNVLFAINSKLAEIMNKFPEYDVSMEEVHHIHKLDAPSGTAITLANQITENLSSKTGWTIENKNEANIYINVRREGEVTGFHKIIYDSEIDTLEVSHNAKSRKGFVLGALLAAEYMKGKSGIHSMKNMLKF